MYQDDTCRYDREIWRILNDDYNISYDELDRTNPKLWLRINDKIDEYLNSDEEQKKYNLDEFAKRLATEVKLLSLNKRELTKFENEFKKNDSNKLEYDLLPSKELAQVVEVLTYGAKKYGRDNWKLCKDKERYINALFRHLEAYRQGERLDKEDNLPHLAHLTCNALFLMYLDS